MALFLAGHVALVGTLYLVQVDLWEKLLLATDSHDLTIDAAEGPVTAHAQMLKEASPAPWLGRYFGDLLTMVINHLLTGMILQVWRKPCDPIVLLEISRVSGFWKSEFLLGFLSRVDCDAFATRTTSVRKMGEDRMFGFHFVFFCIYIIIYSYFFLSLWKNIFVFTEGRLQVKLPTIWGDEKQTWQVESAEVGSDEKQSREAKSEERNDGCTTFQKSREILCFSNDLCVWKVGK